MEEEIIRRAQGGDTLAFQQLVEHYHQMAWRTARILLKDATLTEDVLQEAWIDVWRGLPRFQSSRPLRPWLLTIVTNRCRMALRRSTPATVSLEDSTTEIDVLDETEDLLKRVVRQEGNTEMRSALTTLPTEQQRVLELRYFADLELNEIAVVMGT